MTVSRTVEQEDLASTLKAWLVASEIPLTMPLELFFLPGEVIIRPQPPEQQKLIEWFDGFRQRYDDVLRQLAGIEAGA